MLLTVIIPIYNRAEMLTQALKSLRWQTYKDFRIIICDNASQENLKAVVQDFQDLNIDYHRYEDHVGPVQNFIRSAKLCKTPFMKFLCSDNLLFPTVLEKQLKALLKVPDAAMCAGGTVEFQDFYEEGVISLFNYLPSYVPSVRAEGQWAQLEELVSFNPDACMYRTELFHKVGGLNPGLQAYDDWEIFMALSYKYPVVEVNEPVFAMRLHSNQLTQKNGLYSEGVSIKDIFWMTSNANSFRERLGIPPAQQTFLRLNICWQELRVALASERKMPSLSRWLKMIVSKQMLLTFILGFPFFAFIKILRKPKQQADLVHLADKELYESMISSILFNDLTKHSGVHQLNQTHS